MVKRWEEIYYNLSQEEDGDYVLHSDYAALQASHARLLAAITHWNSAVPDSEDEYYAIKAIDAAIAAEQPFTET